MGHTKPNDLLDLASELADIRCLEGLKEKSPGVFYFKSVPFLHFHDKDGVRWADVKTSSGAWLRLEVNFKASVAAKKGFLKKTLAAHRSLID